MADDRADRPVLVTFTVDGDTDDLIAAYDRASESIEHEAAFGELNGARPASHTICRRSAGMMVVDLWESEQAMQRFLASESWLEALANEGISEPRVAIFPIHRSVSAGQQLRAA